MKGLNINRRRSGLLAKGIAVLSLSIALQGFVKCKGGGGAGGMVTKMTDEQFKESVHNIEDVSRWKDEKNRLILYAAAKYGKFEKVLSIIEKFIQKKKDFQYEHANEEFINALDPTTQKTAIEEAIIQGHKKVVEVFIQFRTDTYKDFINIDINKVGKGGTTLLVALKNNRQEIANILLKQHDIDIKTKDLNSGNTTLHLAIENKWKDTVDKLIDIIDKQDKKLIFIQNKKEETPLHTAAFAKNPNVFKLVLDKAIEWFGPTQVAQELSKKTKEGKTVWKCIYLSEVGLQPAFDSKNIEMFKYAIKTVQDQLTNADRSAILQDIDGLKKRSLISQKYADKLRSIVNAIPHSPDSFCPESGQSDETQTKRPH